MVSQPRKSVMILDTQPVTIEGLRSLLENCPDLKFAGSVSTLPAAMEMVRSLHPAVLVVDKAFGLQPIVDWLPSFRGTKTAAVIWGAGIGNADALRLVQAGAKGVVLKTSEIESILTCLRTAADGATWMADTILQAPERDLRTRSTLTSREQQVVDLVEQGLRNKEIGHTLGIQTGTVKIHLKHIFEKTGCRGRYGLALSGLRDKGHFAHVVM